MRPLGRLHAVTDARVLALPDLGVRAAAIAAAGPAVMLHARDRSASAAELARVALRFLTLARPPEAAVAVSGRADVAAAVAAHAVQLAAGDLAPREARTVLGPGRRIGRSVHARDEAARAVDEGADFLMLGNVFATASHPDRPPVGLAMVERVAALGVPVVAIGGMTPARAREARSAGAWGVAAITALWDAADPAAAALAMLEPWMDDA